MEQQQQQRVLFSTSEKKERYHALNITTFGVYLAPNYLVPNFERVPQVSEWFNQRPSRYLNPPFFGEVHTYLKLLLVHIISGILLLPSASSKTGPAATSPIPSKPKLVRTQSTPASLPLSGSEYPSFHPSIPLLKPPSRFGSPNYPVRQPVRQPSSHTRAQASSLFDLPSPPSVRAHRPLTWVSAIGQGLLTSRQVRSIGQVELEK